MKVVHLNTSDFGGAAMAAIQLHEALLAQGVHSDLLTLVKTRTDILRHHLVEPFGLSGSEVANKAAYKARRALEKFGLAEDEHNAPDNKALLDRPKGYELFTVPYSFFNILDHPLVQQADVIHLHWVSFGMIDHSNFFAQCKKRIVWTMHDMNPFTGGCHHADACTHYQEMCNACPQLKDPEKAHHFWSYKKPNMRSIPSEQLQLIAPSEWLADRAKASSIFNGRSCAVIPNGTNTEKYRLRDKLAARATLGIHAEVPVLMFNAMDIANERKGMHFLFDALEKLQLKNVHVLCVGGHKGGLPEGPNVIRTGYLTSSEEIAINYAAADLFVLPSQAENLPNTISESLLCGTPVVAFEVGGIPEQINEHNGLLVAKKNADHLAHAIGRALEVKWDHKAIAAHAKQRYDRDSVAKLVTRLYN